MNRDFFVNLHHKKITNHMVFFLLFPKKNTVRDILSWLDICLIKALRITPTPHQRYRKADIGAWQTLLRTPIVESERLPKQAAGPGLRARYCHETSRRRRHSTKKYERKYSQNLTGQAGQTTSEIGSSLAGPGRRRVGLESHRPGRAWARDLENITRRAGRGVGQAPSARPGSTPLPRVGPTRKNR